jgi:multicomponent Na+:H+ antiporter subunit E
VGDAAMSLRFTRPIGVTLLWRIALFAVLWLLLTEGAAGAWLVGAPAVLLAAAVSIALLPPISLAWSELLRFGPFFLARSLQGGVDVAWRALHPALPIAPALVDYPLRLPPGLPRVVMINTISLLPGTLTVNVDEDRLTVHVLDGRKNYLTEFEILENRVARLFAINPPGFVTPVTPEE